ncbi:hypothetical protein DBR11_04485 [Pedobacter sp. HMWF019]|uniref:hypothetical protein n=1 Tax=Pedobacter sp. HMWF019 TaxID=2056856 RepID=UPI000D395F53|nr:hypothetical protein [Pedobacter sp. HMWF019]PTT02550.1 hypothetical protein DBR11_04485 [Pedobacter sp. HMWF019]
MKINTSHLVLILAALICLGFSKISSKKREVFTSQQLFTTKVSALKKKGKKDLLDYKAELRDAFKIVAYDGDTTYTELNWTMCPDGKCPEAGLYESETEVYKKLDELIVRAKL